MRKGVYGINLYFYAVLAFVFALFGQTLLCSLLLGFIIVTEKDEWLTKQTIQAFMLSLFTNILTANLNDFFRIFKGVPVLNVIFSTVGGLLNAAIILVILILVIISINSVKSGGEAKIPFAKQFADWAYGFVTFKVTENLMENQPANPSDMSKADAAEPHQDISSDDKKTE